MANTTLTLGNSRLEIEAQPWDSHQLERSCARIGAWEGPPDFPEAHQLPAQLHRLGFNYVIARRPQSEWKRLMALQSVGFHLVDGLLTFARDVGDIHTLRANLTMRLATANDADLVGDLAAGSFGLSRFHNDPLITAPQAARVHREWARNSCTGSAADAVWLTDINGQLAGFCTCRVRQGVGEIVLITVAASFAGQGLGRSLVGHVLGWFQSQGCTQVRVQTQTDNLAAIGLYVSAGFKPVDAHFTLRWAR